MSMPDSSGAVEITSNTVATFDESNNDLFAPLECLECSTELIYGEARTLEYQHTVTCDRRSCKRNLFSRTPLYACKKCRIAFCAHVIANNDPETLQINACIMILKNFQSCMKSIGEDKTGLDVYQASAFMIAFYGFNGVTTMFALMALIVAIAQVLGCILFIQQLVFDFVKSNDKFCEKQHNTASTILAFCLVVTISGTVQFSGIMSLQQTGLYQLISLYRTPYYSLCDHIVNRHMLIFGYIINKVVMTLTIVGSCTIVFTSDSVIDLVLNSAALYFIIEIDDYLVVFWLYNKIENMMKVYDDDFELQNFLSGTTATNQWENKNFSNISEKWTVKTKHGTYSSIASGSQIMSVNTDTCENKSYRVMLRICFTSHRIIHALIFCFGFLVMPIIVIFCY
eukprot:255981_1